LRSQGIVLKGDMQLEIVTEDVPAPLGSQVLIRTHSVGLCGSDLSLYKGTYEGPRNYPLHFGHEWSGTVVQVGENATRFKVGDRVAAEAHKGCGVCRNCMLGRYNICENYGRLETGHRHYGFITPGAYAQYIAVSVKSVNRMPPTISFREGALIDTAGVVMHGLELSGVTPGGTVAVIGPGPIGLIAMRLARALGAARVIAVGRGARLQASRQSGADVLVNFEERDPVKAVREATGGRGVDEAVECSGAAGTFRQAVEMVRKGGRVALVGVPTDKVVEPLPYKYIVHNEIAIFGARANPNVSHKMIPMVASGQLKVADLITHTFPLDQFSAALDVFVNRRDGVIKVVIEPNGRL